MHTCDIAVVGGGIVGLSTAMALANEQHYSVVVLEAENDVASHQTGHNSGVVHSGLYYKPGSHKARNCVAGRETLWRFCDQHRIPAERCGKLVVAKDPSEIPALDELERRGRANGLKGLRRLGPEEMIEREPNVRGVAGLMVPETGIVDFVEVARAFASQVREAGGEIRTGARVRAVRNAGDGLVVETTGGEVRSSFLVNCAGLQCDRVARLCGVQPDVKIVPFRGEYYEVVPERRDLVRHLVYPVPDPRFPFLGVHFTRTIDGGLEAGPNAVLAFKREGYRRRQVSLRDMTELVFYAGFWKLGLHYWRTGIPEFLRSLSKRRFVGDLRKLVPDVEPRDVVAAGSGVRAQAVDRAGRLIDDFRFVESERTLHVLNAPSPAATASISIGGMIASKVTI
ncbi:MAG: L-2-hydroxyglutarate oxidase [bacterium]|nr:L-2-hydroxyglutarate oxidase [bacterium]